MKRLLAFFLCVLCMMSVPAPTFAADTENEVNFYYNGEPVSFVHGIVPADTAATAAIEDVARMLGARWSYDRSGRGVTLRYGSHTLRMTVGSSYMNAGRERIALRSPVTCQNGRIYIPLEDVIDGLHMGYYADADRKNVYITRNIGRDPIPEDVDIPILMYHAVSDETWGAAELFVSPEEMEKQLQYLAENGYTTITFEDLPRVDEIEKPVMLTFDDGYRDNYTELFPLLEKYEAKATIFVITNAIGNDLYLTAEMIREMSDSGLVSIQSHTDTHPDLDTLNEEDTRKELLTSQVKLMRITGLQPFVLCYPTGKYSNTTLDVIDEYYAFGLKMNGGTYNTNQDPFRMNRHYISRYTDLSAFAQKIK
ncbi:MAG: hypothetical protein E7458_10235 [Ruminococcaceae bacterium]|nr:hypothetical protein [Oscillospiraceae bacterium]